MKKWIALPVTLLIVFSIHPVFFAQQSVDDRGIPNDPAVNDQANACYDGGTLEAQCGTTDVTGDGKVTQEDIDWMWTAGWYLIRYEYGLISLEDFPDTYRGVIGNQGAVCTVTLTDQAQALVGLSSPVIEIPLDVINGVVDPNAEYGKTLFGFDWRDEEASSDTLYKLVIYSSDHLVYLWQYYYSSHYGTLYTGWYDNAVVDQQCPAPTPYFLLHPS